MGPPTPRRPDTTQEQEAGATTKTTSIRLQILQQSSHGSQELLQLIKPKIRHLREGTQQRRPRGELATVPCDVPLSVHQQVDFLDASIVGVMQPFGQVLLQVRLKVLLRLLTLQQRSKRSKRSKLAGGLRLPLLGTHGQVCDHGLWVVWKHQRRDGKCPKRLLSGRGVIFVALFFCVALSHFRLLGYLERIRPMAPGTRTMSSTFM